MLCSVCPFIPHLSFVHSDALNTTSACPGSGAVPPCPARGTGRIYALMSRRGAELLLAMWIFPEQGQQFKSEPQEPQAMNSSFPQSRGICAPWEPSQPQGCPLPTPTLAAAPFGAAIPPTAPCAVSFSTRGFSARHCNLN